MAAKSGEESSHEVEKTDENTRLAEIAVLVKQRSFARGYCTRLGKGLMELCDDENTQLPVLQEAKVKFCEKVRKLEELQEQIEMLLTEKEVDTELNEVTVYYDAKIQPVSEAACVAIRKLQKAEDEETISLTTSAATSTVDAKLPRIEIQKFSGGVKDWLEFWGLFKVTVEENKLADITKFSYLKSLLEGEAKSVVAGLAVTAANYKTACELLEKRYGGTEQLIFFHIQALLRVKVPAQPSLAELWNLYDDVMAHFAPWNTWVCQETSMG